MFFIRPAVLLQILLVSAFTTAVPASGSQQQDPQISSIEIPVRISLKPLYQTAEREVPQQAGNWRRWKKTHGVRTRYRAWRGPLRFQLHGDGLRVQAHVRYQVRAEKQLLGLNIKAGCGVDESPRQAIIGVVAHLGWGPDWRLRPAFRILPTRFLDRCELTFADIDVTALIAKEFRKQLLARLGDAITKLAPRLDAIRAQAERSWSRLQEPVQLADGQWLSLSPVGVALSPLSGHDDGVDAHLAMLLQPKLHTGAEPATVHRPLPPLGRYLPRAAGLHLQLAVALDYADLGRDIAGRLAGESFAPGGLRTGLGRVEISGQGRTLNARAQVRGAAVGTLQLSAEVVFSAADQQLRLDNLDYVYVPEDPMLAPQAELFHGVIRRSLEAAANARLQQGIEQWKERLAQVVKKVIPEGTLLDMSSLELRSVEVDLDAQGIRVHGLASGRARLALQ